MSRLSSTQSNGNSLTGGRTESGCALLYSKPRKTQKRAVRGSTQPEGQPNAAQGITQNGNAVQMRHRANFDTKQGP